MFLYVYTLRRLRFYFFTSGLVKQNNNTKFLTSVDIFMQRVVNRFLFRFSIVFKNNRFVFGKNYRFFKNDPLILENE